jgi:hypothetical protein
MNTRCKKDDLVMVISAYTTPELIGCAGTVIRPALPGDQFVSIDGQAVILKPCDSSLLWVVEFPRPVPWRLHDGRVWHFMQTPCRDASLLPITGLPIDEETREELTA